MRRGWSPPAALMLKRSDPFSPERENTIVLPSGANTGVMYCVLRGAAASVRDRAGRQIAAASDAIRTAPKVLYTIDVPVGLHAGL